MCPDYLNRLHDFLGVDPSNLRMAGVGNSKNITVQLSKADFDIEDDDHCYNQVICFLYLYTVILDPDPLAMELHVSRYYHNRSWMCSRVKNHLLL